MFATISIKKKGMSQTKRWVQYFHYRSCLGPLGKFSDATMDALKAHERNEENDTAKHSDPQESGDEIIQDEILADELTTRGVSSAVH